MLLGRGNKNDDVPQNQQIIWRHLRATSARLELNPRTAQGSERNRCRAQCCPLRGFVPRETSSTGDAPARTSSRRRGRGQCRGRSSDLAPRRNGVGVPTLLYNPRQTTVSVDRQRTSFSPWNKNVPGRYCRFAALPWSSQEAARMGAPGDRGEKPWPGGEKSTC